MSVSLTVAAPKTDKVVLRNGDHFTCEVKDLEDARLRIKTDDAGTIFVEWEDIASVTASGWFEIELRDGTLYQGSLSAGHGPGSLVVTGGGVPAELQFTDIVRLDSAGQGFWEGIDGSLNLGFNYLNAAELTEVSINGNALQHYASREEELSLSSTLTWQPDEDSARHYLTFTHRHFLQNRHFLWGAAALSSNEEIGLDLRTLVAAGWGRSFVQTYRQRFIGVAGLAVSRENPTGEDPVDTVVEAALGLGYAISSYDFPKTALSVTLETYPGINPSGSIRGTLNVSIRREIVRDFTLGLNGFDDFDSDPPDVEASKNDFGITLTIGWEF